LIGRASHLIWCVVCVCRGCVGVCVVGVSVCVCVCRACVVCVVCVGRCTGGCRPSASRPS
jgi:hypothetical protein